MITNLLAALSMSITIVDRPPVAGANSTYFPNRPPLLQTPLVKLPITVFEPGGWIRQSLELQRDGLAGNLGEISIWLTKKDNAWLDPAGKGRYGWEEVPYWLRGYARIGAVLRDPRMQEETRLWVEATLTSQRPDGDFGPVHLHRKGFRDLWGQMLMLQILQSWHESTGDARVLPFMQKYFAWQAAIPDDQFLEDYWENSRGGDNLASVYWLYNRAPSPELLSLAQKIHRNTANWSQKGHLPNWHVVNIAQCFREPATYFQQSHRQSDLQASYHVFDFVREKFGQAPGGMFVADENARPGHDEPRQAAETCSMVEQILSNSMLSAVTADPKWVANTEDVAFNTLPAAHTADYRALRYLTAPNMATSDAKNHAPGYGNEGPFQLMNPFSSRCCQHNHTSGWVNFVEHTWMATQDDGLAALIHTPGRVSALVRGGRRATVVVEGNYPFESRIRLRMETGAEFPLYLLIPKWASGATVQVGPERVAAEPGKYVRIERAWRAGDVVELNLPMRAAVRHWPNMKGSVSVDYGPLTFSLRIEEEHVRADSSKTAQWDASWQPDADPTKWPSFEILPRSPWNYGLCKSPRLQVRRREVAEGAYPFTLEGAPLEILANGRLLPQWQLDEYGLVDLLPKSPAPTDAPVQRLRLVPMGAARLRISSFPTVR